MVSQDLNEEWPRLNASGMQEPHHLAKSTVVEDKNCNYFPPECNVQSCSSGSQSASEDDVRGTGYGREKRPYSHYEETIQNPRRRNTQW